MLTIINGDLLEAKDKYIAHQINALSNQAAGLAYQLFRKFPHANTYLERPKTGRIFPTVPKPGHAPGNIHVCGDGKNQRYVINMVGQLNPGAPFNANSALDGYSARESFFRKCLTKISAIPNIESLGLPFYVGCGLANGSWQNYLNMLEHFNTKLNELQKVKITIYKKRKLNQ